MKRAFTTRIGCGSRQMGQKVKEKKEVVTEENVAEVVSMMSGVPVTKVSKTRWIN